VFLLTDLLFGVLLYYILFVQHLWITPASHFIKDTLLLLLLIIKLGKLFFISIYTFVKSLFVCLVFWGESPGCHLFGTASMLKWLKNSSPTTHSGVVWKDGAKIPCGRSLLNPFNGDGSTISCGHPPMMLWAEKLVPGNVSTSWPDQICDPWQLEQIHPLAQRATCLNAKPPEIIIMNYIDLISTNVNGEIILQLFISFV